MKRFIWMSLIVFAALTVSACGGGDGEDVAPNGEAPTLEAPAGGETLPEEGGQ